MTNHYSPLRYPGGKSKLANYFREVFNKNSLNGGHYVEPYAGGAGVALHLLMEGICSFIHLNDINRPLFCFWHSVLNETELLCRKIANNKVTVNAWKRNKRIVENYHEYSALDVGYALLFLNRTNRSGIINGGMIGGYEQQGKWKIDARFYRNTLIERIEAIANKKNHIALYNLDAREFMLSCMKGLPANTFVYIDPPYYKKGQRLYDNYYEHEDHAEIAKTVAKLRKKWILSYDNEPGISKLYKGYRRLEYSLNYSAADHYAGSELMVYSNDLIIPRPKDPTLHAAA